MARIKMWAVILGSCMPAELNKLLFSWDGEYFGFCRPVICPLVVLCNCNSKDSLFQTNPGTNIYRLSSSVGSDVSFLLSAVTCVASEWEVIHASCRIHFYLFFVWKKFRQLVKLLWIKTFVECCIPLKYWQLGHKTWLSAVGCVLILLGATIALLNVQTVLSNMYKDGPEVSLIPPPFLFFLSSSQLVFSHHYLCLVTTVRLRWTSCWLNET